METNKLKEYLSILVDLEKDKHTQLLTINNLEKAIKKNQEIVQVDLKFLSADAKEERRSSGIPKNIKVNQDGKWIAYFVIYYFGCLGALLLGNAAKHFFDVTALTIIAGIIGAVAGGFLPWRYWRKILNDRKQEVINKYKQLQTADANVVVSKRDEVKQLTAFLPKQKEALSVMISTYRNTEETLQKCYACDIIPEDYRSLIPVCMFYDYIKNRRTYSIERNPVTSDIGAINMFEDEQYKKLILTKLNEVVVNLKQIQKNQMVLYDAIQEATRETHRLLEGINNNITDFKESVDRKMDVVIYQNAQIEKHANYLSYVAYQEYMTP